MDRHGICQTFYTTQITNFFKNFTREKPVIRDILRFDVLLIYFEQIVRFFCENLSLNTANFTESVIFALILEKFTRAQN